MNKKQQQNRCLHAALIAVTFFTVLLYSFPLSSPISLVDGQVASAIPLWEFNTSASSVYSPVVVKDLFYVTSANSDGGMATLYCLNASSGTQIWNSTGLIDTFAVANGCIYVCSSVAEPPVFLFSHGVISCLNAYNGDQVWSYSFATTYGTSFSTPVVAGGVVYVES